RSIPAGAPGSRPLPATRPSRWRSDSRQPSSSRSCRATPRRPAFAIVARYRAGRAATTASTGCRVSGLGISAPRGCSRVWPSRAGKEGGEMAMNDRVGDMIARIYNAQMRNKSKVSTPASRLRVSVLDVLKTEGFIRGYAAVEHSNGRKELEIELKYSDGEPVIREI